MRRHLQLKSLRSLRSAIALVLGAGSLCVNMSIAHADPALQTTPSVGEVSLVLGKAFLVSPGEKPQRLKAGAHIGVLDQIMTEANGHVHIRFVDNALVSVRPNSQLEILNYQYDASNPEASSVKLNLLEGVTRAISGDAAKSARDRFRMNTPIAAIGVRGTDFVVSASDESVRALVNEGAIVMAPYSSECQQDAFGPCASNAVELSQSSVQVVEIAGNASLPRLVQVPKEEASAEPKSVELAGAEPDDKSEEAEVYSETAATQRVNEAVLTVSTASNGSGIPVVDVEPPVVDFTPETPIIATALTERQLVWGRWFSESGQGVAERITLSKEEAQQGREITTGNFPVYGLYRVESGSKSVRPDLGVVSFGLSSAQAFYHSDGGVMAMAVNGGSLELDFVARNFNTSLDLDSSVTGVVGFAASGSIYDGGIFRSKADTQNIGGVVSLDGAEAGYFFDKQLGDGFVEGLTLWDAQ